MMAILEIPYRTLYHTPVNTKLKVTLSIQVEFSEEKRNASIDACGGASASQACIFDFLATGDKALAESSGSEQATSESENAAAGEISFNYREMFIISNTRT